MAISLSSWFRDYVYIPLGGNRVKTWHHIMNMFIVWLLTGIWHGANWTFILWGMYYGCLLIFEKYVLSNKIRDCIPIIVRYIFTMLGIMVGWVLFRAETLQYAGQWLISMFSFATTEVGRNEFLQTLNNYRFFWIVGCIGVFPIKNWIISLKKKFICYSVYYDIIENIYVALLVVLMMIYLISSSYNAFIYFQF